MKNALYSWSDAKILASVIEKLQIENFIVAPSDTVIGLLAPATRGGFEALQVVKKRENKPFLVLVASYADAQHYAYKAFDPALKQLLEACWPGPLTLVFKAQSSVPAYMCSPSGTIAVRVPQHDVLQEIIRRVGPLLSTSANKPGEPVPADVAQVDPDIARHAALLIEGTSTPQPSTILDITHSVPRIVREGMYSRAYLEDLYGAPLG
jgi:L-threonylcarbamoyladenylate synthase